MSQKMKNTTFFNFLSTKAEENNNNAGGSSDVTIRNMGPRTAVANYVDKWKFKKDLTSSDIDVARMHLPKGPMLDSILCHLSRGGANVVEGHEETVRIKDVDTGTYHGSMKIYSEPVGKKIWLKGHWLADFVSRKGLQAGYTIGICWNANENCFDFSLLDPRPE